MRVSNVILGLNLTLLAVANASGCRQDTPRASDLSQTIPGSIGEVPLIGHGFNTVAGKVTGTRCFDFAPEQIAESHGYESATVELTDNMDAEGMTDMLSGEVGMKYPVFPGISVVGTMSMAREFAHTEYTENKVLKVIATGRRVRLARTGRETLAASVKDALGTPGLPEGQGPVVANAMCGNEYVQEVTYGMRLVAMIKMEFNNEYDRRAFGGSLGAEVLGGIASIRLGAEASKVAKRMNATVTLRVIQEGGDASRLLCMLPGRQAGEACDGVAGGTGPEGEQGPALLLQCTYETRAQCYKVFQSIYGYAQQLAQATGPGGDASTLPPTSTLMPLAYVTSEYPSHLPELHYPAADAGEIDAAAVLIAEYRQKLMARLAAALEDERRARSLQDRFVGLVGAGTMGKLEEIQAKAKKLARKADKVLDDCVRYAPRAEGAAETARPELKEQIRQLLEVCKKGHEMLTGIAVPGTDLYYDRKMLNPKPESISDFCVLSQFVDVLNGDDRHTSLMMVEKLRPSGLAFDPSAAPISLAECEERAIEPEICSKSLKYQCDLVERELVESTRQSLSYELSRRGIVSLRPLVPLFPLIQTLSLRGNKIMSVEPLLDAPNRLLVLDLGHNEIDDLGSLRQLEPKGDGPTSLSLEGNKIASLRLLGRADAPGKWGWSMVDLADNLIEQVDASGDLGVDLTDSIVKALDLSRNPLLSTDGLATAPKPFLLRLFEVFTVDCPFQDEIARRCVN
jgi:hypothetical protein